MAYIFKNILLKLRNLQQGNVTLLQQSSPGSKFKKSNHTLYNVSESNVEPGTLKSPSDINLICVVVIPLPYEPKQRLIKQYGKAHNIPSPKISFMSRDRETPFIAEPLK